MTREEAISQSPSGRKSYWFALVVCTPMALAFACDAFGQDLSLFIRFIAIGGTCIFLLTALQSAERLFYPQRAAARSSSWPEVQRLWIGRIGSAAGVCFIGLFFFAFIARHSGLMERANAQDLEVLAWGLALLNNALRDLLGERIYSARRIQRPTPVPWTQLSPIHSDYWGRR
jgi:hypothetical protein